MAEQVLIQLTTPEEYPVNPSPFPAIQYVKLVNFTFEISRPQDNKLGYINAWFAKGYLYGDGTSAVDFYEAPGMEPDYLDFGDSDLTDLDAYVTGQGNKPSLEIARHICQLAIDKGHFAGTVVDYAPQ